MRRIIQFLCISELNPLPVMACVFSELSGAFEDYECVIKKVIFLHELEDGGIIFLHDEAGLYKNNSALYTLISQKCPNSVFICWYWRDLSFRPFNKMIYTGEYYLYLHMKKNEITDYDYMTNPLFVPLKLRADDSPEKIGTYTRQVMRDYCFMGGGYKMDWVPSEYTGIYHRVIWDNYIPYNVRRNIYLSSIFAFGFQSDENIRTGHLSQRIFEGLAYGCIVLCNNKLASTFTNDIVVYVSSKEELVEKMQYYKEHPEEVEKKQNAGYEWVKKYGTNRLSAALLLDKIYDVFGDKFSDKFYNTISDNNKVHPILESNLIAPTLIAPTLIAPTLIAPKPIVSVNIMGGLGNQLFQIAAAYAYAKKNNGTLQIIHKTENGKRQLYWDNILEQIKPYLVQSLPELEQWYESLPTMYSDIGVLSMNGKFLNGYLQTSKYYYDMKDDIKHLFKPNNTLCKNVQQKYSYLISHISRVVVIHCRRTDYIIHKDFHRPLEGSYYKNAVDYVFEQMNIKNPLFVLCGDDNGYWNEIRNMIPLVFSHDHIILNESDIYTFVLLQQFNNFIMSNSTFIWWCAWLSSAKNVIVPAQWFGPAGPSQYEDIYEDSWVRM